MMRTHSQSSHKKDIISFVLRSSSQVTSRVDVGAGALADAGSVLKQQDAGSKVLLISQSEIADLHGEALRESLCAAGYSVETLLLAAGEECKSTDQLLQIWQKLQSLGFTRNDTLVALGGGAVSDVSGFAASTYLRGIKSMLIPTTLLSQVDAAIGGKTGINLGAGKNLAGTFHLPDVTLVDTALLKTLPAREVKSGLGEIIKYAFIERTISDATDFRGGPRPFLKVLEESIEAGFDLDDPAVASIIATCIKMKLAVVGKDMREGRLRRCLNLGHTLAHGLEKVSNYSITHGEAVAIGLTFAANLSQSLGRLHAESSDRLKAVLHKAALPVERPSNLDKAKVLEAMAFDKKKEGSTIKFVLPIEPIGTVDLDTSFSLEQLAEHL
jgi:3-dehydroquinate synthase